VGEVDGQHEAVVRHEGRRFADGDGFGPFSRADVAEQNGGRGVRDVDHPHALGVFGEQGQRSADGQSGRHRPPGFERSDAHRGGGVEDVEDLQAVRVDAQVGVPPRDDQVHAGPERRDRRDPARSGRVRDVQDPQQIPVGHVDVRAGHVEVAELSARLGADESGMGGIDQIDDPDRGPFAEVGIAAGGCDVSGVEARGVDAPEQGGSQRIGDVDHLQSAAADPDHGQIGGESDGPLRPCRIDASERHRRGGVGDVEHAQAVRAPDGEGERPRDRDVVGGADGLRIPVQEALVVDTIGRGAAGESEDEEAAQTGHRGRHPGVGEPGEQ